MRHRTVDLDGPVHYIDFGGEGKPLVMVHGLGGNAMNWMAVGPEFAKTHHAVALDLAGFGRTPLFRRSAAVGENAALVHRFIEEVIGEPVVLMGNSMGGHIAILAILSFVFLFAEMGGASAGVGAGLIASVPLAVGISALEIIVVLVQAYVFTLLTAVFVGMAIHVHH